jgi:hypothetical protein
MSEMRRASRSDQSRTEGERWLRVTEAAALARRSYGQMLRLALIGAVVSRRSPSGKLEVLAESLESM